MSRDYPDQQFLRLEDNCENKDFKMSILSPPPSSRLLTGLFAVCAICFIIIIILIVTLRNTGETDPDQKLHHGMSNLSDGVNAHVERSTRDDAKIIQKLKEMEANVQKILTDKAHVTEVSYSDMRRAHSVLLRLSEWVLSQSNGSMGSQCEGGWLYFQLSCYKLFTDEKNWTEAKQSCEKYGAHLVVIDSQAEQIYLEGIFQKTFTWIGLTDSDGKWKWVDGSPYDCMQTFWEAGQPDEWLNPVYNGNEDCVQMRVSGEWNDAHCSIEHPFICEKEI